jgi:hypothetical protein
MQRATSRCIRVQLIRRPGIEDRLKKTDMWEFAVNILISDILLSGEGKWRLKCLSTQYSLGDFTHEGFNRCSPFFSRSLYYKFTSYLTDY